jgi:hypothetical protein
MTAPDDREPLGRIFHEQGRIPVNAEREKPFGVLPWEDRTDEQREIDMRGAHAVAVFALTENAATWGISCTSCAGHLDRANTERERAERAGAKLAALRQQASAWAMLAPPDDWGESTADTIKSDCGRAILAIGGGEEGTSS